MAENMQNREVIFEFQPIGNIMRVSAIDTATMTEAVIQCPITAGDLAFKRAGLQKLEYILRKKGIIT